MSLGLTGVDKPQTQERDPYSSGSGLRELKSQKEQHSQCLGPTKGNISFEGPV